MIRPEMILHRSRPLPRLVRLAGVACGIAWLGACGGPQITRDTASKIEPKAQLSEQQRGDQPDNFTVRIDNVADERSSYKNYIVLYINDHEVAMPEGINNVTSSYRYSMRLQAGVYDVRAEYHTVGAWREKIYKIVPNGEVAILPDQRTILDVRLKKDERGVPVQSPTHFRLRHEKLEPTIPIP
jgi:hypothetical protein